MNAIFVGGSGGNLAEIIDWSLAHLTQNGALVLNFILLDNVTTALNCQNLPEVTDLQCTQLQISQHHAGQWLLLQTK